MIVCKMAAFVERSSESFLHVVCRRRRRCVASSTLSSSIKEEEEETEGDRGVRGKREGGVGIRVEEGGVGGTRGMGGVKKKKKKGNKGRRVVALIFERESYMFSPPWLHMQKHYPATLHSFFLFFLSFFFLFFFFRSFFLSFSVLTYSIYVLFLSFF